MSRVLFVSIDTLFPLVSGYRKSVYGQIKECAQNNEVMVVEFDIGDNNNRYAPPGFLDVQIARVFHPWTGSPVRKNIMNMLAVFSRYPRIMFLYASRHFAEYVADAVNRFQPDEIVLATIWSVPVLPKGYAGKVTLISQDIARKYLDEMSGNAVTLLKRISFYVDSLKIRRIESDVYGNPAFNHVMLTEYDGEFYRKTYGIKYELATNNLFVSPLSRNVELENPFFLFAGSVTFSQNHAAISWFVDHVYPELLKQNVPPPRILVTGKTTGVSLERFKCYPNIVFTGELPEQELENLQSRCLALLSPIVGGTGIKIKNLEAVQKGVPVIMTPHSARGIANTPLAIIADSNRPDSYAHALVSFMASSSTIQAT